MSVVAHPRSSGVLLTKKQIAQHLGRSERWVELRVREGMPSVPPSARYASRRFDLALVQTWLRDEQPTTKPIPDRVADLERTVVSLQARLRELEESSR